MKLADKKNVVIKKERRKYIYVRQTDQMAETYLNYMDLFLDLYWLHIGF